MADKKQQRLWKLKVRLRARGFDFKLNLQRNLPSWKLHRLSLLLRIRKHLLELESESGPVFKYPKPRSRSRVLRDLILYDFLRISKKKGAESQEVNQAIRRGAGCCCVASLVLFERHGTVRGVAALVCAICLLLVKLRSGKWRDWLLVLVAVVIGARSSLICFHRFARTLKDVFECCVGGTESRI